MKKSEHYFHLGSAHDDIHPLSFVYISYILHLPIGVTFWVGGGGSIVPSHVPLSIPKYYVFGYVLGQAWQENVKLFHCPSLPNAQYLGA